jgi:hypothetical protein
MNAVFNKTGRQKLGLAYNKNFMVPGINTIRVNLQQRVFIK